MKQDGHRVYSITSRDISDFNSGDSGKIIGIWWEILDSLPPELTKEAIRKGFVLVDITKPDPRADRRLKFVVINGSEELQAKLDEVVLAYKHSAI